MKKKLLFLLILSLGFGMCYAQNTHLDSLMLNILKPSPNGLFIKNLPFLITPGATNQVVVTDSITGQMYRINTITTDSTGAYANFPAYIYYDTTSKTFKVQSLPIGVFILKGNYIVPNVVDSVCINCKVAQGPLTDSGSFYHNGALLGTNSIVVTKDTTQNRNTNVTFQATASVIQRNTITLTQGPSSDTTSMNVSDFNVIDANKSTNGSVTGLNYTYRKTVTGGSLQKFTGFSVGLVPSSGDSIGGLSSFYWANIFNPSGFDGQINVFDAGFAAGSYTNVKKIIGFNFGNGGTTTTQQGIVGLNVGVSAATNNFGANFFGTAQNYFHGRTTIDSPLVLKFVQPGSGTPNILVHLNDSTIGQMPYPSSGGGGVGVDSTITITTGTSTTVTDDYNQVVIDPSGGAFTNYTLTLPTNWHSSKGLKIYFGHTNITSGAVITGTLTIIAGSGQTILQALIPGSFNAGEEIEYHLVGTVDHRTK